MTPFVLRQAGRDDLPGIWNVRYAVTENTLRRGAISDDEVIQALEVTGRGWVVEDAGAVVAFAIGDAASGGVWALFVHPCAQGRGHGKRLHDVMVEWLWSRGLHTLWLGTGSETRARAFYEKQGWRDVGPHGADERRYELQRPGAPTGC